jgi:pyrimidine-nucleoside phosphorylase
MLILAGAARDLGAARKRVVAVLQDGTALGKFRALVAAQGGDVAAVDDPGRLPKAGYVVDVPSPKSGYLRRCDARTVGEVSVRLGAGRARKGDPIDHGVGLMVHAKVGDRVQSGGPLFTVHAKDRTAASQAAHDLLLGVEFSKRPVPALPLFYRTLRS